MELEKFAKVNGYNNELKYIFKGSFIQKSRIRMRSNFQPNIRLVINILLVIGILGIALNITPIIEL